MDELSPETADVWPDTDEPVGEEDMLLPPQHPVRTIDAADPAEVVELEAEWRAAHQEAAVAARRRRMAAGFLTRSELGF